MVTEYRLRPTTIASSCYWLQRRSVFMGIGLWWADIELFTSPHACWRHLDGLRDGSKTISGYIYEKDRK